MAHRYEVRAIWLIEGPDAGTIRGLNDEILWNGDDATEAQAAAEDWANGRREYTGDETDPTVAGTAIIDIVERTIDWGADQIADYAGIQHLTADSDCDCPVETVWCADCGRVEYTGPDCGHVAQPTPVAGSDLHSGQPVCAACYEAARLAREEVR
jgi:hypothetical protein